LDDRQDVRKAKGYISQTDLLVALRQAGKRISFPGAGALYLPLEDREARPTPAMLHRSITAV
jgi:hypothetical protein